MDKTEALVEIAARAICKAQGGDPDLPCYTTNANPLHNAEYAAWEDYQAEGRAAIRSLAPLIAEQCAGIAENPNRAGREWVPGSLWDSIARETAAAIRAAFPKPVEHAPKEPPHD